MSFLHIIAGDEESARYHLQWAHDLDPLSHETMFYSAYFHYMLGDYETALSELDKCLAHNSRNNPAHAVKCHCLLMQGRYDEVIHYFEGPGAGVAMPGDSLGFTGLAYALKKDVANTEKYLTLLLEEAKGPRGFNAESYLFLMYAITGKRDEAFSWIGRAVVAKAPLLLLRFGDPLVAGIKDDPRYAAMQNAIFKNQVLTAYK
jgi:tetratricopeptide (TPR) repeat protein